MDPVEEEPTSPPADVEVLEESDRYVLALGGEIDLVAAETVESALESLIRSSPERLIVLDMSGVTFIDSSGLKPLLRAHARGTPLAVRSASPAVRAVISLTGLDEVLRDER